MKASKLIALLQQQVDVLEDKDVDIEVSTMKGNYTNIWGVTYNIFGRIEIVIK